MRIAHVLVLGLGLLAPLAPSTLAASQNPVTVGFESGAKGWSINGFATPDATGGNPGACLHWNNFVDTFWLSTATSSHPAFIGDYTAKGPVSLSIDVQADFILFSGQPVSRDLFVILHDDNPTGGASPAGVWFKLGTLQGTGMPWTHFSATVDNVLSTALPAGWKGLGDFDLVTFDPILPAGRTWTNVLAGVDRIEFTTEEPGFFYGSVNFKVRYDNVAIAPLLPPAWSDQGHALAGLTGNPQLVGSGTLAGGSSNTLSLSNAAPSAPAGVFVGLAGNPTPFKGGLLDPVPVLAFVPVATDPAGALALPFVMPAGVPASTELWVQCAIQDGAAVKGVALANAVKGLAP